MENKEYKILTSNMPSFSSKTRMSPILEEESKAGWDLEEVYDSFKIRLSRDKNHRENDKNLDIDPYRTKVGINNTLYMGGAAIITIIVIYGIIQLAAMSVT